MNIHARDHDVQSTAEEIAPSVASESRPKSSPQERSPLVRYGAALAVVAVLLGGFVYMFVGHDDMPPPRQVRELTVVNIVPPPPPPPPPPPQQMPEPKMIEQPKMVEPEIKQEVKADEPKEAPPDKNDSPPKGPLGPGPDLPVGPGPSNFGAGGGGGGGGGGSRWGWYTAIVTAQVESALHGNRRTRNAVMQVQIRLWADGTGRVNKVQLVSSTGDAELDALIRNDVLGNLTLREPPPKDMPMPMVTRVTARRPS